MLSVCCDALIVWEREKRLSSWQRVKHRMFLCVHLTPVRLPAGFRRHMTHHMTSRWCRLPALTENECLYKANAAKQRLYVECFSPVQSCVSWLAPYSEAEPTSLPGFRGTQGSPIKVTDAVSGAGTKWRGQSTLRSSKRHSAQRSKVTVWHPGVSLCYSGSSSMGSSSDLWSMALVLATDRDAMALTASASSESPRLASSRDRPSLGE